MSFSDIENPFVPMKMVWQTEMCGAGKQWEIVESETRDGKHMIEVKNVLRKAR